MVHPTHYFFTEKFALECSRWSQPSSSYSRDCLDGRKETWDVCEKINTNATALSFLAEVSACWYHAFFVRQRLDQIHFQRIFGQSQHVAEAASSERAIPPSDCEGVRREAGALRRTRSASQYDGRCGSYRIIHWP